MIVGLGIDIADTTRISKIVDKFGDNFLKKIMTDEEIALVPQKSIAHVAGRFAAKEAAVKALGTGFSQGIVPSNIVIGNNELGQPTIHFTGKAMERARCMGATSFHLSISHEKKAAVAIVILEKA